MKNNLNFLKLSVSLSLLFAVSTTSLKAYSNAIKSITIQDSLGSSMFLQQAAILTNEALLTSKIAADRANNSQLKSLGQQMVDKNIQLTDELRKLGKIKNVNAVNTSPQSGLRPDGRIDSAPINLQDTSRLNNATGEAVGSSKTANSTPTDDVDVAKEIVMLKGLNGSAFDKAYQTIAVNNQTKLVAILQKGTMSTDIEIKKFAKKALTITKSNLKKLEKMSL
ncbi:DUF4142 domain-containing protein [Pedobacter mendelii]|uniref:DUF4142 domain-containing protein n=1 Tax=Pedobacter mendelii TaxID=1908240 RepID=A0ABQ2BGY9_9SPHI|nr:DUF4142 domain-containing protein [Pedobacter mendelii]GGI23812.1 hypothetical protein GCM10008119_09530 [Pedobacter mendelii]